MALNGLQSRKKMQNCIIELSADDKKKLQEQKTLFHDQKQKNFTEKQNYRKTKL